MFHSECIPKNDCWPSSGEKYLCREGATLLRLSSFAFLALPLHMRLIILCTLGFFMASPLVAQVVQDSVAVDSVEKKRVKILRADKTVIYQEDTTERVILTGNIELKQDSVFMYCDSAVIVDKKEVDAFGNIIIQQGDSLNIFADSLFFDSDTSLAVLKGEVVLQTPDEQLWTRELEYNLSTRIAYYTKGATLLNDSTQLTSRVGYYMARTKEARFIEDVVVINPDFNLRADSLNYDTEQQLATFIGPTIIEQGASQIFCTSGFYDIPNKYAVFSDNAQYLSENKKAAADKIIYEGNQQLIRMEGEAHYFENDKEVQADTILYFEGTGDTRLIGNASYRDSTRYVTGEEIYYNDQTDQLETIGRSVITEGAQTLEALSIRFDNSTGLGNARGNVFWSDTAAKYSIECDQAIYNKQTSFVKAFGDRRPLFRSLLDEDTLYLTADTLIMETLMSRDSAGVETGDSVQHMRAFADVRIFKSNLQGLCDSLRFNSRDSVFRFIGEPVMWSDTTQFTADTIHMLLKNETIDRFLLRENGFIVNTLSPSLHNQVKGKYITAFFENDNVETMLVEGNAESIYYVQDDDKAYIGVNKAICSEILILFEESEIDEIKFLTNPNSEMIPITKVNPLAMRLKGFRLVTTRPASIADLLASEFIR